MTVFRTLIAMSVAALATACAGPDGMTASPPTQALNRMAGMGGPTTASMEPRMKTMQDMHQRMRSAKTPAERQALMADHMKAMQDGMAMMKEMHGGMQGMGGMGLGEGTGRGMPADMVKRHQMMTDHMASMQMMMDMMSDRMPPASATK